MGIFGISKGTEFVSALAQKGMEKKNVPNKSRSITEKANYFIESVTEDKTVKTIIRDQKYPLKLLAKGRVVKLKSSFRIYDLKKECIYDMKMDAISFGTPTMRMYDEEKNEIASVKKYDFEFKTEWHGKKYDTITRCMSLKNNYDIKTRGWHMENQVIAGKYFIYDQDNNEIMRIRKADDDLGKEIELDLFPLYIDWDLTIDRDTYLLEYTDPSQEPLILLLLMCIEVFNNA